jgi:hypothetical protein
MIPRRLCGCHDSAFIRYLSMLQIHPNGSRGGQLVFWRLLFALVASSLHAYPIVSGIMAGGGSMVTFAFILVVRGRLFSESKQQGCVHGAALLLACSCD